MYTGPHIIKDGLVFGYDTGYGTADNNTATRFYPGESSVNLLPSGPATGTGNFTNQSAHNESFTYSKVTNYKGRADVHKLYINPSGSTADPYADYGGQYHKSGGSAVGDVYALSLDFHVAKGSNSPGLVLGYANGYKSPTSASAASLSANVDVDLGDGWTRRTIIATITTAGNTHWRFGCNTNGNETEVYIDNVQIELKPHATPFVDGTRSSTQSLIDLKETTDIDVSNVTFDSTGQPEFDGTDDLIYANAENDYPYPHHSWEVWFKTNQVDSGGSAGLVGLDYGRTMYLTASNGGTIVYTLYSNMTSPNVLVLSISGGTNLLDNEWHQVVCSRGDSAAEIWVDGSLVKTASNGGQPGWNGINQWSTMAARFGDNPNNVGLKFTGIIPIIKIYNKQLSGAEVLQNYNAYKNRFSI